MATYVVYIFAYTKYIIFTHFAFSLLVKNYRNEFKASLVIASYEINYQTRRK